MSNNRNESLAEMAAREMAEKTPWQAVKEDVSKLLHGVDVTSGEQNNTSREK